MSLLPALALFSGATIAIQASLNAQLGAALNNSLLGTTIAFLCSAMCCLLAVVIFTKQYPSIEVLAATPRYLWFGGLVSAIAIGLLYYLIPRMGVGPTISYSLAAQVVVAMLVSHFGLFELPIKQITLMKLMGTVALVVGVLLVNWEK